MYALQSLIMGFSVALQPQHLLFAFLGCVMGTLTGVLPGIGPIAGMAILLPITFQLDATSAIIMLAAIYYGSMYGGTITTILMNVPGEGASAITALDGYQMAKQGRAGAALAIAAIGSFIGGTIATITLVVAAPPLASIALRFGPPEFFGLMVLGVSLLMGLSGSSVLRGLVSGMFGLALTIPGTDLVEGIPRMSFGSMDLLDGVTFVPVIMGLFGIAEILLNAEAESREVFEAKMSSLMLTLKDLKDSFWPIVRGTVIGISLGVIPGIGTIAPTLGSYAVEKRMSKHPERFGTGAIEGVAGPEATNNAYANAAMIPLFTLGVPASPTLAVLVGAFMMNGLQPGPFLFRDNPEFVWAVIASLYIGNVMLLILNLPLVGLWVKILKVPYSILFPLILAFTAIGSYSIRNSVFDVWVLIAFGVIGYLFKKLDIPIAPVALTLILGPLMEKSLRQSMAMSGGDVTILLRSPVSTGLLAISVLILLSPIVRLLVPSRLRESIWK